MSMASVGFRLLKKQRRELEKARDAARDVRAYRRICAILWLDVGRAQEEVAQLLWVTDRTVRYWVKLFEKGGLDLLCQTGHGGRRCEVTGEQLEELKEGDRGGAFSLGEAGSPLD